VSGGVVVVGDLMLDVSEHGTANRLSPEAPVVVLLNPVAVTALGGAGNTAANTRSLGQHTTIIGVVGADASGRTCVELAVTLRLEERIVAADGAPTTVKRRFLAQSQQIMRLDIEGNSWPAEAHTSMLTGLNDVGDFAALVLSDYDKGAITADLSRSAIARAKDLNRPVVVDTKRLDVSCFRGSTVIAPNHHEAQKITGIADPERAAAAIARLTEGAVLVTLGADGMLLFEDDVVTRIPSHAREVADVTGAGDTVTAGLAVALAEGATLVEAARWANWAAAEAVSHQGTYAVPRSRVDEMVAQGR
jgi:D-beta-D-heptose 7-phosphate kinase/D-beta-D-heptose 1-phosphate adenosyltransferase